MLRYWNVVIAHDRYVSRYPEPTPAHCGNGPQRQVIGLREKGGELNALPEKAVHRGFAALEAPTFCVAHEGLGEGDSVCPQGVPITVETGLSRGPARRPAYRRYGLVAPL